MSYNDNLELLLLFSTFLCLLLSFSFFLKGELPELTTVAPSGDDVKEALSAMELEEDGSSRLNYFLQVYRASDYPVYADYAIHRAMEQLPGPRQIVVTK